MKLLFLTDTHIKGNNPRGRRDDFPAAVVRKLREVASLAEEYRVKAVIHGGDLFDTPNPSLALAGKFLSIFRQMPAPVYIVAGNHDLFGQNPATLSRTILGFAAELGVFKLLQPGRPVYLSDNNVTIQLTGQHFHYDIDRRDPRLDYAVKAAHCDAAVHVVHGMLLDRPLYPGAYTLVEKIAAGTEALFTLAGHVHLGFKDTQLAGKYFLNPGALVRITAQEEEIKRVPAVLLLDFEGERPGYKKIPLRSSLPGEEVLDRSHIEREAFQKEKLSLFVREIKASGDYRLTRLEEIIETIATRDGLPGEVKQEALTRLAKVQEELGGG